MWERFKWYDVYRGKSNLFFCVSKFFIRSLFILDWPNPLDFQLDGVYCLFFRFIMGQGGQEVGGGAGGAAPINSAWALRCVNTTRPENLEKRSQILVCLTLSERNPNNKIVQNSPKQTSLELTPPYLFLYLFVVLNNWALSCLACSSCACLCPLVITHCTAVFFWINVYWAFVTDLFDRKLRTGDGKSS